MTFVPDVTGAVRGPLVPTDEEPAIEVENLGVRYDLRLTRRTTIKGSLSGMFREKPAASTHFWALRHLSFKVAHGESLAVLGPNGAGKSTLLLALAGILDPSEGLVDVHGSVSTLLTLGAGFEMELTGRDNIDLAAAFLGIDHRLMADLTPEIIAFADIGAFIDAPVKTYSTGMRARLGFAIATSVTPDILLLDEVLGTGDQIFRNKSQKRIHDLMDGAKAIILVTHDLNTVAEYCNRAILIEQGTLIHVGSPQETVDVYRHRAEERKLLADQAGGRFTGDE